MPVDQWLILVLIATPTLILARDAWNLRRAPRQTLLAAGVLAAILINIAITVYLGR